MCAKSSAPCQQSKDECLFAVLSCVFNASPRNIIRHHELLHLPNLHEKQVSTCHANSEVNEITKQDATVETNAANVVPCMYRKTTALPVLAVKVYGAGSKGITTYALLDQESEVSFINSSLAKKHSNLA